MSAVGELATSAAKDFIPARPSARIGHAARRTRQNSDRLLSHPSCERYRSSLGERRRPKCFGSLPTEPSSNWPCPLSQSLRCCRLPQGDRVWIFSWQLVEKEINGGNTAVPGNDEISPGISWRLTRAARYPLDPPAIAQLLWRGNGLISKVRMSSPDRARDAIDLVAATVDATWLVEHAIFGVDLVNCRAPAHR